VLDRPGEICSVVVCRVGGCDAGAASSVRCGLVAGDSIAFCSVMVSWGLCCVLGLALRMVGQWESGRGRPFAAGGVRGRALAVVFNGGAPVIRTVDAIGRYFEGGQGGPRIRRGGVCWDTAMGSGRCFPIGRTMV